MKNNKENSLLTIGNSLVILLYAVCLYAVYLPTPPIEIEDYKSILGIGLNTAVLFAAFNVFYTAFNHGIKANIIALPLALLGMAYIYFQQ